MILKNYSKFVATNKKSFLRKSIQRRSSQVPFQIISKETILPDFLYSYIKICNSPDFIKPYTNKIECIQTLYIPSIEEQYKIIATLKELNEKININEIAAYLIYHLVHHNPTKANELLAAYQEYNEALKHIIENIQSISLLSNNLLI